MAPPRLSDDQINCGPHWIDREIGGQFVSLGTPGGEYDLARIAARLPGDQQPDAVVCLVDSARCSVPRNLRAFDCPKILLVADTHHLTAPIANMVHYALSEPFDRVVLLYDRHHEEFFRAAGVRRLHWFPGLTFPHGDAAVAAARTTSAPLPRLAFVGTTGICHTRRTQLLTQLNAHGLPLTVAGLSQREALGFYGASLVGFNASLNGDLNLRVLEILASGAMLLTDTLTPAAGLTDVWQPGRELLTYATPAEMVERAQWAIAHPMEARAIGRAGAQWFDTHFNEAARRAAFQVLVTDGIDRPEFALPTRTTFSASRPVPALIAAFEYVQELHRNLDRVVVALDDSVPEAFAQMCVTLPRIEIRRGLPAKGQRVDFLAVGRKNFTTPDLIAAAHVWCWEGGERDRVALVQRCTSMGFALIDTARLIFSRRRVNTHTNLGALALVRLEQGAYNEALGFAKEELAKNPKSADALMAMIEVAQETGNTPVLQALLAKLAVLAPHHPRRHQILAASPASIRARRTTRLLRDAQASLEQRKFADARKLANEALTFDAKSAAAHSLLGRTLAIEGDFGPAVNHLQVAAHLAPENPDHWLELGFALRRLDRASDAMGAFLAASALAPAEFATQLALGDAALAAGHGPIAMEALTEACRLQPGHAAAARWLDRARELARTGDFAAPRDLLLSHVEVTRLQGTGVLLERFFPNADGFVTVRSRTLYQGKVDFGGVHYSLDLPGLPEAARREVLRRVLAPYRIRRILCVPFFASDFMHGVAARELTGAPLCTYVMDDQVLHAKDVPQELAQRLFAASDLRLAISPEMVAEYSAWFECRFGLLPPIVVSTANEAPNVPPGSPATPVRCAMVGNIWSAKQFEQLRTMTRAAGLAVDWFGNASVAWLPQDRAELERDGIFRQGFLPEEQLAPRLARYPFVVIPSGALDGTEDNEWLTRLSLPSRMVFILTKTFTPMLILGSPKTAAAAFVNRFGVGASAGYDAAEVQARITELTSPARGRELRDNARRLAPCFLLPDAGEWIWRSLAAKQAGPAPFDPLYRRAESVASEPPAATPEEQRESFTQKLDAIIPKLSDYAFLDSHLPPEEPRQQADIRGAVRFLHHALAGFGALPNRLRAIERLAIVAPNHRGVLVAWAELLEESGDRPAAAVKARKALALFYDDVHTQTLFMRCAGEVNHHATNGQELFCARPFQNFEIYQDGSTHVCNCTCVPFSVGNAIHQTAEEIWQSPAARAIRASILDGSFRFCAPMTCPWRFDLPKRAERPAEFERLKQIGIDGTGQQPKHLNLSYDRSCNLSCPSCRTELLMADDAQRRKNDGIRDRVVLPLLETAETVYITGSGDAFGSPHFRGILRQLCEPKYENVEIHLGTNGQLITPRLWAEIQPLHARFREIMISIDGATPETFERLRRGSTWEKLLRTMDILQQARRANAIRRLRINMVVQTANFREMRPLLALGRQWAVDTVCFYRLRQWGNYVPAIYLASDIANPLHPQHRELLAELAHPDFADPIVDHYDMYELIAKAQAARGARRTEPVLEPLVA